MSDKWPLDRSLIPVCGLSGIGAQIRRSLPCEKGQSHQSEGRASWWINCLKTHYYDAAAYQMIGPWGGGFDFRVSSLSLVMNVSACGPGALRKFLGLNF